MLQPACIGAICSLPGRCARRSERRAAHRCRPRLLSTVLYKTSYTEERRSARSGWTRGPQIRRRAALEPNEKDRQQVPSRTGCCRPRAGPARVGARPAPRMEARRDRQGITLPVLPGPALPVRGRLVPVPRRQVLRQPVRRQRVLHRPGWPGQPCLEPHPPG
jgi:hypothetical protein